jgi:hypothetical protein
VPHVIKSETVDEPRRSRYADLPGEWPHAAPFDRDWLFDEAARDGDQRLRATPRRSGPARLRAARSALTQQSVFSPPPLRVVSQGT